MNAVNHIYRVELRVYARDLIPERITERTRLQPYHVRVAGSRTGRKVHRDGMWGFAGEPGRSHEWNSLEDGLSFVLDALGKAHEDLRRCIGNAEMIWWCGHFQSSFDGGPTLSAELLGRLAEFGASLYIDNYFSAGSSTSR